MLFSSALALLRVVDLKTSDFQPEFSGKMNFYPSVDDLLRHQTTSPAWHHFVEKKSGNWSMRARIWTSD